MLKHRGLKTLLTHGFLVIMMVINEAALSSLETLATGTISQPFASLTSHCPITSNKDVKLKKRKPREPTEEDIKGNEYK